jgi:hypothetical protein
MTSNGVHAKDWATIQKEWTAAGQGHVFAHFNELKPAEATALVQRLSKLDPALISKQLETSRAAAGQVCVQKYAHMTRRH